MTFEGKILAVMPLEEGTSAGTGNHWCNREIVVIDDSKEFDEKLVCRLRGEKAENFSFRVGERVRIQMGFRAYQSKNDPRRWFNEIIGFKIEQA